MPPLVRAEGIAERVGDIVIACTGPAGREVTGNLLVSLNTTISNRETGSSTLDVPLTISGGQVVYGTRAGVQQVSFNGLRFTLPSTGQIELRVSNIRADATFGGTVSPTGVFGTGQSILASLAFNGTSGLINFQSPSTGIQVAVPERGLYHAAAVRAVACQVGSPLPDTTSLPDIATFVRTGTVFSTLRVTEGFPAAFAPRMSGDDHGTRIVLRFTDYPTGAQLFAPTAIAGSSATVPTSLGDFDNGASGGVYTPGSNQLLLVRVLSTDQNGAGGIVATSNIMTDEDRMLNGMSEVALVNGSGIAVYEVVDGNPSGRESAQIPVFLGLTRRPDGPTVNLGAQVQLGPVSTVRGTSATAPIPRFSGASAPLDCLISGDCETRLPKLSAEPLPMDFVLLEGMGMADRRIYIANRGGGRMQWTARVDYKSGSDWIRFDRTAGVDGAGILMIVSSGANKPGTYEATVVIDAGTAGIARYPVTLKVNAIPPPATPKPAVTSVLNGASFVEGPVVRGSLITLRGSNFGSSNVTVTFDGKPARVVFSNSDQINVLVPADLGSSTARLIVKVGEIESAALTVPVADVNPGIFGILNEDGSRNSAINPAAAGKYIQVYATGLLQPDGSGMVTARLHDSVIEVPAFYGPAPGMQGVQQVNILVDPGFPTMQTELVLCSSAGVQRVCGPPVKIWLRAQ